MRKYVRFLLLLPLAVILGGCAYLWQPPSPAPQVIFGSPVMEGDHGKIVVSVANMPQDGVGAIAVKYGGITYPADKMSDFKVEGRNGFKAIAWDFSNGKGGFVAVSTTAISSGPIAVITFKATRKINSSDIEIAKNITDLISLASAHNTLITDFKVYRPAYYAR